MMRSLMLVALCVVGLAGRAEAQIETNGRTLIGLQGSGFIGASVSMTTAVSLTRFVSDALELGGDAVVLLSKSEGADLNADGFVYGRARYNFVGQSLTVPYLSFGAGTGLESPGEFIVMQGGIGLRRFLSENAAFNMEAAASASSFGGSFTVQEGISILFGLSVFFGK